MKNNEGCLSCVIAQHNSMSKVYDDILDGQDIVTSYMFIIIFG